MNAALYLIPADLAGWVFEQEPDRARFRSLDGPRTSWQPLDQMDALIAEARALKVAQVAVVTSPAEQIVMAFDYASLTVETRIVVAQRTMEIKERMRRAAQDIVEIGERLIEVKTHLGHGQFGAWLKAEFEWSDFTARQFINVAKTFKTENFSNLNVGASALYLLASPSTPDDARAEALERAEAGERIGHKEAQAIVGKHKPAPKPPVRREAGEMDAEPLSDYEATLAEAKRSDALKASLAELERHAAAVGHSVLRNISPPLYALRGPAPVREWIKAIPYDPYDLASEERALAALGVTVIALQDQAMNALESRGLHSRVTDAEIPADWDGWRARAMTQRCYMRLVATGVIVFHAPDDTAETRTTDWLNVQARIVVREGSAASVAEPVAEPTSDEHKEVARIRRELEALANRQAAELWGAADEAALKQLDTDLEALSDQLNDEEYGQLARAIGDLQEWTPPVAPALDVNVLAALRVRWVTAVGAADIVQPDMRFSDVGSPHVRLTVPHGIGHLVAHTLAEAEAFVAEAEDIRANGGASLPPHMMLLAVRAAMQRYMLAPVGEGWDLDPYYGGPSYHAESRRDLEAIITRLEQGEAGAATAPLLEVPVAPPAEPIAPSRANDDLYQHAERGPLSEIVNALSPQALRLLSLTHFGGSVGDTDEDMREWLWEYLTQETQKLDVTTLAWAMRDDADETRKAA